MTTIEVNGRQIHLKHSPYHAKLSLAQYKRTIIEEFRKLGIESPYLDIRWGGGGGYTSTEGWAEVSWMVNGQEYHYRCDSQSRDVDNLAAIAQMITQDVKAIKRGMKTFGQVMNQFRLDYNPDAPKVRSPREILGIPEGIKDADFVAFKFKQLAKTFHPDNTETGNAENFKEIQKAYEDLKKELGGEN